MEADGGRSHPDHEAEVDLHDGSDRTRMEEDVCGCWRAEIPFTLVTTTKTPTPHKGFKVRQGGGSLADMLTRCRSRRRSKKGHFGKNCCNQLEKGKRKGGPAWKKKSCNCGGVPSYKWPLVPATGIAAGASPHTHTHTHTHTDTLTSVLLSVGGALQVVLSTLQMSQPMTLNLCLLVMPVMSLLLFSPIGRSDENVTLSPGCHLHAFNLSVRSDRRGTCRGTHLVHACVGYCESSAFPSRYSVLVASNFTRNVTSASRCCTITKEAKVKVRLECPGGRHHDELEILTAEACRCDMCRTSRY
ncbi:glycoprotein hormone alpha-2 isoform X3 [Phycodurus eques]|nr:glycoprotein hormone alpha-2 isoform X3 [Phycodurus eques]